MQYLALVFSGINNVKLDMVTVHKVKGLFQSCSKMWLVWCQVPVKEGDGGTNF